MPLLNSFNKLSYFFKSLLSIHQPVVYLLFLKVNLLETINLKSSFFKFIYYTYIYIYARVFLLYTVWIIYYIKKIKKTERKKGSAGYFVRYPVVKWVYFRQAYTRSSNENFIIQHRPPSTWPKCSKIHGPSPLDSRGQQSVITHHRRGTFRPRSRNRDRPRSPLSFSLLLSRISTESQRVILRTTTALLSLGEILSRVISPRYFFPTYLLRAIYTIIRAFD